jgi:glycosyltransferase involved in cell wall biosynthesis
MTPRRILLYTHAMTGGGAERVWALLASGLARRGHDVVLVTDFDAPENETFVAPGVRRVTLGGNHWRSVRALAQLLREEKPDVAMSALSVSNLKLTLAAALAGALARTVLSYHGYASSEPQTLSRIGYVSTGLITRLTAATVCVSDGLRDYIVRHWKAPAKKAVRIYNPVDKGPLEPAATEAELRARGPIVLSAGRFVPYKDFPALVRAFARVTPSDARLVILGEGPERPKIEAEIARLDLGGRVELAGYQPEPWRYYASASCFALASKQEPFGLVVVEALANGLPIVSTNCDGPCEILAAGRFGAVTKPGDEQALARAITAALAQPGDPRHRIERAQEFSLAQGLDQYELLFETVIAEYDRRRAAHRAYRGLDRRRPAPSKPAEAA